MLRPARDMKRSSGVSLVEVLVTIVVISAGLLAYVSMQRGIYREATLSTGRMAATELALSKLEDLRGFTVLYTTTGQKAFQDIAANAGGSIASGNVTVDNTTFNRTWAVADYWYAAGVYNAAATTTSPAGSPMPSFKLVTMTVTWTDQNGAAQTLTLPSIIAATDPHLVGTMFR